MGSPRKPKAEYSKNWGGGRPAAGRWRKDELAAIKRGDADELVAAIKGRTVEQVAAKRAKMNGIKPGTAMVPAQPKSNQALGFDVELARRIVAESRAQALEKNRGPESNPFRLPTFPPKAMPPKKFQMAMDQNLSWAGDQWATANGYPASYLGSEGLQFFGYPYLAELTQRPEYRVISETIADEATRKWIDFEVTGDEKEKEEPGFNDADPDERASKLAATGKTDKVKALKDEMERLEVRDRFYTIAVQDGFFGRSHLYIDCGVDLDDPKVEDELKTPIGNGRDAISKRKIEKGSLKGLKTVEAVWVYPTTYNAINPLKDDWYNPEIWWVLGKQVHRSRLPSFVGHPVPDLLKPAYSFGGLSLSQMAKPYVDIWLKTRESVGALIHSFSVMVLMTDVNTILQPNNAGGLIARAAMFNALRDNQGLMMINKATEDFKNVSASMAGLHELQAQSQEHMCSVARIPLVKFTGISPSGLNASSEGEVRSFYDTIAAYQNRFFRPHLTTILNFMQLSLWGEIDPEITFEFEPLWEMSDKEKSDLQKSDADRDQIYVDMGVLAPQEIRKRIADDPEMPYANLDPEDLPDLREEEESGLQPEGGRPQPLAEAGPEAGATGKVDAGKGGEAGGGDANLIPFAQDAGWNEALHPRGQPDNAGQFGPGGGSSPPPGRPGTAKIPAGRVRRFHVTDPRNEESIRSGGLKYGNAKGIEGPKAIYSWDNPRDAQSYAGQHGSIVEFHDDPKHYESNPTGTTTNVPPENIVAIHQPWHEQYHYAKENDLSPLDLRAAGYEKAAAALEAENKPAFTPDNHAPSQSAIVSVQGLGGSFGGAKNIEVLVNPTERDIISIGKESTDNLVRVMRDRAKNLYAWSGDSAIHGQVAFGLRGTTNKDRDAVIKWTPDDTFPESDYWTVGPRGDKSASSYRPWLDQAKTNAASARSVTKDEFVESQHPRIPSGPGGGEFAAKGSGGGTGGGAAALTEEEIDKQLHPKAIAVGGDEWNKKTAIRLEREYVKSRPALEKIVNEAIAKHAKVEAPGEEDDDEPPSPEEWDGLTGSTQEEAKEAYIKENYQSYYDSEEQNWHENGDALDDAKFQVAYDFDHGHDEWVVDAITDYIDQRHEDELPRIPYTQKQLLEALTINYENGHSGSNDGLTIEFDDKKLQEPDTLIKGQLTLPGIEEPDPSDALTKEMREDIIKNITLKFDEEAEKKEGDMEPPEYLQESANESADSSWDEMDDDEKYEWTKKNTSLIDEAEAESTASEEIDELPKKFDPLEQGGSHQDYRRTQRLARYLSEERAGQLLVERGIIKDPAEAKRWAKAADTALWDGWKSSSTSNMGKVLQVATAEELGGKLRELDPKRVMSSAEIAKSEADSMFPHIGGYAGVKAYIRAKWETTQYLLDKADTHVVNVYRAVSIPTPSPYLLSETDIHQFKLQNNNGDTHYFDTKKEAEEAAAKLEKEHTPLKKETVQAGGFEYGSNYEKLPDLHVVRNGAASTTTDQSVANKWDGSSDRVVLRASVPRTAVLSIPAYGQNIHSEHEVVVAGTSWVGWDAWAKKAPTFSDVPMAVAA